MTQIEIASGPAVLEVGKDNDGDVYFDLIDRQSGIRVYSFHNLTPNEARAIRDALTEALAEDDKAELGTLSVKVVPDTSGFVAAVFDGPLGEVVRDIVRAEVQALAESAVDYAVKPAAKQALANLAGAAELARS